MDDQLASTPTAPSPLTSPWRPRAARTSGSSCGGVAGLKPSLGRVPNYPSLLVPPARTSPARPRAASPDCASPGADRAACESYLATMRERMDPMLFERITRTAGMTALHHELAQHRRTAHWHIVRRFFERYDLLLTPTLSAAPFPIGSTARAR